MVRNTSKHKKTYSSDKTAVITIEAPDGSERVVEATHYIRSDDGTVSIYQGARSDGIDIQTHITRCVIDRVDELPSHAEAFSGLFDGVDEIETEDDDQDDEPELVTDGGQPIGAPITRTNPARREHGNQHYCETRGKTVYCGRLECPYCSDSDDDQEDGGDDQELIADGGQVIEPGDEVLHAGEQWRVARCNSTLVEIYRLGSVSEIVPVSAVEQIPEVQG